MPTKHSNPKRSRVDRRGQVYRAMAPYNFVPLPDAVTPAPLPLEHDRFHLEARSSEPVEVLSGYFDCDLETCSPVYVRAALQRSEFIKQESDEEKKRPFLEQIKNKPEFFYTHDPAQPVIPGSTLRGMIRNLIEIIAHGRMRWVNDSQPFTYRAVAAPNSDPLSGPYRQALGAFGSRIRAGYLVRDGQRWHIHPAKTPQEMGWPEKKSFITVPERKIGGRDIANFMRFDNPEYKPQWHPVGFEMQIRRGGLRPVDVVQIGQPPQKFTHQGVLVCTGNMLETQRSPSGRMRSPRKNHTLILPKADTGLLAIPLQVIDDYRNSLTPYQNDELTNWGGNGWGCLKDGAPVFYVADSKVLYFGHCPNFRIPAVSQVSGRAAVPKDFVPATALGHSLPDLAEALFGWTEEKENGPKQQRAGRVFFSDARLIPGQRRIWYSDAPITPGVLSFPKPSTFQHYLVQDRDFGHDPDDKASLANFTSSPEETQIRGNKLYWHRGRHPKIEATEKERKLASQLTRMKPLAAGARFSFRVHFENLRPQELGALCWALILPGESGKTYRHKLGMGKPLGMGAIAIAPRLYLTDRAKRYQTLFSGDTWAEATNAAQVQLYLQAFEKYMLEALGKNSEDVRFGQIERIRMLLMLLSWPGPNQKVTRYLEIERSEDGQIYNEYKERPVLPDPAGVLAEPEAAVEEETIEEPVIEPELKLEAGFQLGTVKAFGLGPFKDYGFIQPHDGGEPIFVHKNHLKPGVYQIINDDQVSFRVVDGIGRKETRDVEIVKAKTVQQTGKEERS